MSKLDRARDLCNLIQGLKENITVLESNINSLSKNIKQNRFIYDVVNESATVTLTKIKTAQGKIKDICQKLQLDISGKGISELAVLAEALKKNIGTREKLRGIINFIQYLQSDDQEAAKELALLKQEAGEIKLEDKYLEEAKRKVRKFELLQKVFQIEEPKERFRMAMQLELCKAFDYVLVYQLIQEQKGIYILDDGILPLNDTFEEEEQEPVAVAPLIEEVEPVEAASEAVPVAIPAVAVVEEEDAVEALVEEEEQPLEVAAVAEEEQVVEKAPVAEQVGTKAVSVKKQARAVEAAPAPDPERKFVREPGEAEFYHAYGPTLAEDCEPVENKKTFSISSFKRELKGMRGISVEDYFKFLGENFTFSFDKRFQLLNGSSISKNEYVFEKYVREGYVVKHNFMGYTFYTIAPYGMNVYKSPKGIKYLGIKDTSNLVKHYAKYQQTSVLNALAYLDDYSSVKKNIQASLFGSGSLSAPVGESFDFMEWSHCCNFAIRLGGSVHKIAVVGIYSDHVESFKDSRDFLEKIPCELLIVSGINQTQARAIAAWLQENTDLSSTKIILYRVLFADAFYNYADDQPFSLKEYSRAAIKMQPNLVSELAEEKQQELVVAEPVEEEKQQEPVAKPVEEEKQQELVAESVEEEKQQEPVAEPVEEEKRQELVAEPVEKEKQQEPVSGFFPQGGTLSSAVLPQKAALLEVQEQASESEEELNWEIISDYSYGELTEELKQQYLAQYREMLLQGNFPCALVYTKVLAAAYDEFKPRYMELSYALNNPLENCAYMSSNIIDIFCNDEDKDDFLFAAAALRNAFSNQYSYDYDLYQFNNIFDNNEAIVNIPSFKDFLYTLNKYKLDNHCGMDKYADYRRKAAEKVQEQLQRLEQEAKEKFDYYCCNYKREFKNKRYTETRNLVFDKNGDFATYLQLLYEHNVDEATAAELKSYLRDKFIKDGANIDKENLDDQKLNAFIAEAWEEASKLILVVHKTSKLVSGFKNQLFAQVKNVLSIFCDYVNALEMLVDDDDQASAAYRMKRKELLAQAETIVDYLNCILVTSKGSAAVLQQTVEELQRRIDGSYLEQERKYFFAPFLLQDNIMLNQSYLPYLQEVDKELPSLSLLQRIVKQAASQAPSYETRLQQLISGVDNFGTLKNLLRMLKQLGHPEYEELYYGQYRLEESLQAASSTLDQEKKSFFETLELRQSYGQIDNSEADKKESILQKISAWYQWSKKTENFGFFRSITEAYLQKLAQDARPIGEALTNSLEGYKKSHPEWQDQELVSTAVAKIEARINKQNYSAAEDLLNRLVNDELATDEDIIQEDYLQEFLEQYAENFEKVYNMTRSFKNILRLQPNNKDKKGAIRLADSWIVDVRKVNEASAREFLTALGFNIAQISNNTRINDKYVNFNVTLKKPINGRKANYKHPIAIFGSKAETSPFRVLWMFGRFDAGAILDTLKEIGEAKPTMIFLDAALSVAVRRTLARKVKEEFGQTFIIIDRVVMLYLVKKYKETSIQRILMAVTLPYAYYQPYVVQSSNIMPPEIFIGRREELRKIESADGVNIVYGGRQLGKSALMRMAEKDINYNENGDRALLIDIKNCDYRKAALKISRELSDAGILQKRLETEDWTDLAYALKRSLLEEQKQIHYFLLLLDEADTFIESCIKVKFAPLDALKDVQGVGSGKFKYVLAGLRDVIRFNRERALSDNSVLTQMSSLTVKPFSVNEARELLELPLSYLGFRFAHDEKTLALLSSIFSNTNYFPGLIQLYCSKLIESMKKPDYAGYNEAQTPPYMVSETHIQKILGEQELQKEIRNKFYITMSLDEDDFYKIIALIVASLQHEGKANTGVTPLDVLKAAQFLNISKLTDQGEEKIQALMEEMRELNILQLVNEASYRFSRYSFFQMMGTADEVLEKLFEIGDEANG